MIGNHYASRYYKQMHGNGYVNTEIHDFPLRKREETTKFPCTINADCNNGTCIIETWETTNGGNDSINNCECDEGYLSLNDKGEPNNIPCLYEQISGLTILLLSIFLGNCGIDRCVASKGVCCGPCCGGGICLGFVKGLTAGGVAIWWIIDIIFIAIDEFTDGNGVNLTPI